MSEILEHVDKVNKYAAIERQHVAEHKLINLIAKIFESGSKESMKLVRNFALRHYANAFNVDGNMYEHLVITLTEALEVLESADASEIRELENALQEANAAAHIVAKQRYGR